MHELNEDLPKSLDGKYIEILSRRITSIGWTWIVKIKGLCIQSDKVR